MFSKVLTIFFTLLALLIAVLASVLPQEKIIYLVNVTRFFEVMIPILAVGALLKYLCSDACCKSDDDK